MAALDFGMALARGMLPQSEAAQKDLLDLAGGRNVFKSEDWWNKAVDKQISEGYRQAEKQTGYLMPSGEYVPRTGTTSSFQKSTIFGTQTFSPGPFGGSPSWSPFGGWSGGWSLVTSDIPPEGAVKQRTYKPGRGWGEDYVTKQLDVFTSNAKREDFTAGELADIERAAERGAARVKAESAASKAAQKRLIRGTGGLSAKAILPGDKPATGLPELGTTGLGLGTSTLGKGFKL